MLGPLIGTAALFWFAGYACGILAEQADNGVLRERWDDWRARRRMQRSMPADPFPLFDPEDVLGASDVQGGVYMNRCGSCRHDDHLPGNCYPGCRCGASR